jgi:hypothetical protein
MRSLSEKKNHGEYLSGEAPSRKTDSNFFVPELGKSGSAIALANEPIRATPKRIPTIVVFLFIVEKRKNGIKNILI